MKSLVLTLILCGLGQAQILSPVMFGVDPTVPGPTNTDSGGSCSGAATSRTCTGTTNVSWADASADFIRYTNDGSTIPTFTTGTLYTTGISTASTTTYKAIGCKVQNSKCGTVTTSVYTISAGGISWIANGVGSSSSSPAVTATSFNVQANDKIIIFCRSGGSNSVTMSVTDTAGDGASFSSMTKQNDAQIGNTQMFYYGASTANSANFYSCNFTAGPSSTAIIVMQFRGGLTSSILDATLIGTSGVAGSITSGSFSTVAANEVIVMCGGVSPYMSSFTPGAVGGTTANITTTPASGNTGCEYLVETSTESSITAAISTLPSYNYWNWGLGSFK